MKLPPLAAALLAFSSGLLSLPGAVAAAEVLSTVSRLASPEVSYGIQNDRAAKHLALTISVAGEQAGWPQPQVNVGLAAAEKKVLLSGKDAKVVEAGGKYVFTFQVDSARLASARTDLAELRLAFDVAWPNTAGAIAQRENFFVLSSWPVFRPIGEDPAYWLPFSLTEHEKMAENLRQQLRVTWKQPMDGKATVVIEDAQGHRVRNLISGRDFPAGEQSATWDGFDETGKLVAPGKFTWRVAAHPGIKPDYLMSFYNPGKPPWKAGPTSIWMGDHSSPSTAASNGSLIALGCPVAEDGNNIVIVDQAGNKLNDANLSSFIGLGHLFLAMDDKRFYAFSEGAPGYNRLRKDENGKDYIYAALSLVAWTLDGQQYRFPDVGKNGDKIVREYKLDPAAKLKNGGVDNLRGAVFIRPYLYLSLHDENKIEILNADNGGPIEELAVPSPGPLATDGKRLVVMSGQNLFLFDNPAPQVTGRVVCTPKLSAPLPYTKNDRQPWDVATSLAFNAAGEVFVADNGVDQNIKVFSLAGKLLRQIGKPGGRPNQGKWVAEGMHLPLGIALDGKGQLWVAENNWNPKRISVWKGGDGSLVQQIFGPTYYGASGGGFDAADTTQWIGGGALWNVDMNHKTAAIEAGLYSHEKVGEPGVEFRPFSAGFVHKDGRTFIISKDSVMRLYELRPDGRAKLWATYGALHSYEAESPRWWVPAAFTEQPLLKDILADFTEQVGPWADFRNAPASSKLGRNQTVLWVDTNGDDICQPEEIQVVGDDKTQLESGPWGYQFNSLDWKLAAKIDGKGALASLNLHGFLPSGAPDWRLQEAFAGATPIPGYVERNTQSYANDSAGRFLFNADPMTGVGPDGSVAWTYPNDWTGVHGSHDAPLPETGVMQGSLSYLGVAPLDAQGDVTVINGNHGRFFVMTTDGMYLDEMFQDVRISREASAYRIGGECFGGFFARDAKNGRYLLQSGGSDYRIFELKGLDKLVRLQGSLDVTAGQLVAAQRVQEKQLAEKARPRLGEITSVPAIVAEWGEPKRSFPSAKVTASREGADLVLVYDVKDPSPWVNQGTDPQLLFKTGDCVAFEFSTDPKANLKRPEAAIGDKRLLIAPFQDKPLAVLYNYKVAGTAKPAVFNSPSRSATVDRVTMLNDPKITVKMTSGGYTLTARVPLAELGLPATDQPASLRGDFGVIYGDDEGRIDILRSYWSNQSTGLVNDVPGEATVTPSLWGQLEWK